MESNNSELVRALTHILKENITDFAIDIVANTVKGEGYTGDIYFITLSEKIQDASPIKYDLVLKSSKQNEDIRKGLPVKEAFENEIYVYTKILPTFETFQKKKNIEDIFKSYPKCCGTFVNGTREIIALQNLKKKGYVLWNSKKPLTDAHIKLTLGEYAKLHAISTALQDQDPERFERIVSTPHCLLDLLSKNNEMLQMMLNPIEESCKMLENELSKDILDKWSSFKDRFPKILESFIAENNSFRVITHGDCWNNNFLYYHTNGNLDQPSKVAILDWQLSRLLSPVMDLSYFLFASCYGPNIEKIQECLKYYYDEFSAYLKKLGSNADQIYSYEQLLIDWKQFAQIGALFGSLSFKVGLFDSEEVSGVVDLIENGLGINQAFKVELKDNTVLKENMRYLIKYLVKHDLI